jgi:hypothetical protein
LFGERELTADPFELCRALYGAFNACEEPAAALVGYLAEAGVLWALPDLAFRE